MSENTHECEAMISPGGMYGSFNMYQCRKKAKYFEDGKWYCGLHAPSKIKDRRDRKLERDEQIRNSPGFLKQRIADTEQQIKRLHDKLQNLRSRYEAATQKGD